MAMYGLNGLGPGVLGAPAGTLGPSALDVAAARLSLGLPAGELAPVAGLPQAALTQALNLQLVNLLGQLMVARGAAQSGSSGSGPAASGGCCSGGSGSSGAGGAGASAGASGSGSSAGTGGAAPSASGASQGEVKDFIGKAAEAYGADPKVLSEIARRESNFKPDAVNNWDSNAKKGTPSKGMFQFIEPTFNSMAPKAKAANPKAWEGLGPLNWMDWRQQALTTAWAIKNGQGSHWATYAAAKQTAGSQFA